MAAVRTMSVQIKKGPLRASPSFLGKVVAEVAYGDRLEIREEKAGWARGVLVGRGVEGWIHSSALTTKKVVLKSGASDVQKSASGEELALAGKGFNKQVEGEFKSRHQNIDFAPIDQMERIIISAQEAREFLDEGEIKPAGGAS